MKGQLLHSLAFVMFNVLLSLSCIGQIDTSLNELSIKSRDGRFLILQYDRIPMSHETLAYRFKLSDDPVLIDYAKKYKRKNTWSGILGGIGLGFVGIWAINETANNEFYGTDGASTAWRRMVVGTSISFCTAGFLFSRSAKRQVNRGVEHIIY